LNRRTAAGRRRRRPEGLTLIPAFVIAAAPALLGERGLPLTRLLLAVTFLVLLVLALVRTGRLIADLRLAGLLLTRLGALLAFLILLVVALFALRFVTLILIGHGSPRT
jgi:hypothetical protein